jgi:hypothetical protein
LDDFKERRGYSHLKEEALDRTMWIARFGRGFGPVVRQTTKWITPNVAAEKWRSIYAYRATGSNNLVRIYFVGLTCRKLMSAAQYTTSCLLISLRYIPRPHKKATKNLKTQRQIRQPECDRSPLLLDHLTVLTISLFSSSSRHEHRSIAPIAAHSCVIPIGRASSRAGHLTAKGKHNLQAFIEGQALPVQTALVDQL